MFDFHLMECSEADILLWMDHIQWYNKLLVILETIGRLLFVQRESTEQNVLVFKFNWPGTQFRCQIWSNRFGYPFVLLIFLWKLPTFTQEILFLILQALSQIYTVNLGLIVIQGNVSVNLKSLCCNNISFALILLSTDWVPLCEYWWNIHS